MEFDRLLSAMDAEALESAAETLLAMLEGASKNAASSADPAGAARRKPRPPGPGGTEYAPGTGTSPGGASISDAAINGNTPEPAVPGPDTANGGSGDDMTAELARLGAELSALSAGNRRALGAEISRTGEASGTGTVAGSATGSAPSFLAAAGAAPRQRRSPGPGGDTAAADGSAAIVSGAAPGAAEAFSDAEAVSEFFRRDSRRYDSGFGE